jgi:catechol 2,3-dioxygenase-like lactoylglutathione lyase family enzyme
MLSHVTVGITDFDRAFAFYDALMSELGYPMADADRETAWAYWRPEAADRPLFIVCAPYDGQPAKPGNGPMIALLAPSRAIVDRCYSLAMRKGARDEGGPGLRPQYHPHFYGCYFRDPDGNKICVCCHEPDAGDEVDS